MNKQVRGLIGRRPLLVWLPLMAVMVGLLWFSIQGVGTASADGGLDNAQHGSNVSEQYQHDPSIATCLLPGIPC